MSSSTRLAQVALLASVLVGLTATPAGADAAGPSDFRSEVTEITPATEGVHAAIRGGDSFLEVSVDEGREVTVEGYSGEPYLRFLADGTVERNVSSPATYLNEDRTGGGERPPGASADAEPEWEEVADDGRYAWHDHRVHWMSEATPPVDRGQRVPAFAPWRIPISVDGEPVEILGVLVYEEDVSPLPWAVLAVAVAGAVAWWGRRRPMQLAAAALVVASILAVVVGRADFASTPDGSGNPLLWVLPVVSLVAAGAALALAARSIGVVIGLVAVATLSGWALLRLGVWMKPVLPTELPFALDRAAVGLALGASAAAAYLAVTSGVLALPDLDDDEP
jgi:hypothetical protein